MDTDKTDVIRRVEGLLRLAGKNPNEHEAAAAHAKAMRLLEEHNLSLSNVDETGEGSGRRADERVTGGFYEFEQRLWRSVGELNFCMVWHQHSWVKRTTMDAKAMRIQSYHRRHNILRGHFYIVGRVVNIASTRVMSQYLLQVAERLVRERLAERGVTERINTQLRTRWAVSFREGIVEGLIEKIEDRRRVALSEERARLRAAQKMAMEGASTATGVTLASVTSTEYDANADFVFGEGWSTRRAAERASRAMWRRMSEDEQTQWAVDHPEEARARAAEDRAARRSRPYSGSGRAEKERDWGAFRAGHQASADIGIDQQAGSRSSAGSIDHTAERA